MYVYAFLRNRKSPVSELILTPGIEGNLQIVETQNIAAAVETELTSLETIENDEMRLVKAVLTHDRLLCELFRQTTILPLRFGTIFRSRSDLLTHLNQRQSEYLEKLQQFEGKAEYMLKLEPLDAPVPSMDTKARGKSYLLAKKNRHQIVQEFQAKQSRERSDLQEAIANTYIDATIVGEPQGSTERIYLLVAQEKATLLLENIQKWQQNCPSWQLHLGEPLPPYHFV